MKEKIEILENTIMQGLNLEIQYNGGSQPGTYRRIKPLDIKNDNLYAKCLICNEAKYFKIDKIYICRDGEYNKSNEYQLGAKPFSKYKDILNIYEKTHEEFEKLGWITYYENNSLGLYLTFKNGNRKKKPDVFISYMEYLIGINEDGSEFKNKNDRPYLVFAKNEYCFGLKYIDKAADKFIEYAKRMAPNNNQL
jgi:hypothetical protein